MDANLFSDRLRRARMAAGLQGKELAQRLGISRPYLSQLEKGLRHPSPDLLNRLASQLGVSLGAEVNLENRKSGREGAAVYRETAAGVGSGRTGDPTPCEGCASRDAVIAELRSQVGMLIKANAALADAAGKHGAC